MNFLNFSDMTNRPLLKYIIIAVIAVNAIILGMLLFGPSPSASASAPAGNAASPSGNETSAVSLQDEEEESPDESGSYGEEDFNGDNEEDPASSEDENNGEYDGENTENDEYENGDDYDGREAEEGADEEGEMPEEGPLLELVDDHVTLKVGDNFNFYDYIKTMRDRDGSELSRYIHLIGNVDTWTPGEYTVTFQITSQIDGHTASEDLHITVEQ